MKIKSGLFCTVIMVLFSNTVSAGLLVEPQLGYNLIGKVSDLSFTSTSPAQVYNLSSKYNALQYGARLGYQLLGVMGGLSYNHSAYTSTRTFTCVSGCSSSTDEMKYKRDDLGIFAGYNAPILLRAWVAYSFSVKQTNTVTNSWDKGTATELGVGFTGFPFLSLNLIYKMLSYTSAYDAATGVTGVYTQNPTRKANELIMAVSAPFNL
jgi:hypothetical protein